MTRPRLLDLPHGHRTIIDEATWPTVRNLTLYRGNNGYVYYSTWENGKSTPRTLHSLLLLAPRGMHTDHINGDPLDNRLSNLRIVTPQMNQVNRRRLNRNNTSGARGVSAFGAKWRAQICVEGSVRHLGVFSTKAGAIAARKAAEFLAFGEFCP